MNELPYDAARKEIQELAGQMREVPETVDGVMKLIADRLGNAVGGLRVDYKKIFGQIAPEIAEFSGMVRRAGEVLPEKIRYYTHPVSRETIKYVSGEVHDVLIWSRCLGLIPLGVLKKLKGAKIVSVGASAAMGTLDMLGALGVRNIDVVDFDEQSGSKTPLYPGGSVWNIGRKKAQVAVEGLYLRNPDGKYRWFGGMAVKGVDESGTLPQITFDELIPKSTKVVVEAVDASWVKDQLRVWMRRQGWEQALLVMPADVSWPYVGFENLVTGYGYNQRIRAEYRKQMSQGPKQKLEVMRDVWLMIEKDFGIDHQVEFILAALEVIPFWTQHPIASRETAGIVGRGIVWENLGKSWAGQNVHPNMVPRSLGFKYDGETGKKVSELLRMVLKV